MWSLIIHCVYAMAIMQARKADKSREKDEQEDTREKLDAEFSDIMGLLQTSVRPTRANGTDKVRPQLDEYDRMTKVK